MIHKPQSYLNCINVKLWLKTCFPIDFEFLIFLFFFPFLFSPYLFSLGHIYSYNHIYMHIYRPKQAESRVGRTREEQSTRTCMKGGGLCYSSWMSAVGSHSPALLFTHHSQICHDHRSYFGQWNWSRSVMSPPNRSTVCPTAGRQM